MSACLSLDNQTKLFRRTVEIDFLKQFKKHEELEKHLAGSFLFISIGINHFGHNCSVNYAANSEPFGQFLLNEFSIRLQRMYTLGARKFLVIAVPLFACLRSSFFKTKPKGSCYEDKNNILTFYDERLTEMLHQMQSKFPGAAFAYSNYFGFLELRASAKEYADVNC